MILPLYPLLALHWSGHAGAQRWMGIAWGITALAGVAYQTWATAQVFADQERSHLRGSGSMLLMCLIAGGIGVVAGFLSMR